MKKLKALINKMIDIPKLIITIWLLLWVILFMLVAFKFCFNIWYPIVVENEKFIAVCNFIDSVPCIRYIILFLFYMLNSNVVYLLAKAKDKYNNKTEIILLNITFVVAHIFKNISNLIGVALEVLFLVLLPIIINLISKRFKKKFLSVIIPIAVYLIINLWQMTIIFVRDIDSVLSTLPILIFLVMQIDYYVFIINSLIGVKIFMGTGGIGWWWSRQLTKYEAYKEKELKKTNPDMDYVNFCDSKIKECKEKLNEIKK